MSGAIHIASFKNPPVAEVVCGAQFAQLASMLAPHLGIFWKSLGEDFSHCEAHPLLPPFIEPKGDKPQEMSFEAPPVPPFPRTWFVHRGGAEVVQVQPDRLLANWRRIGESETYPRFSAVREKFEAHLRTFASFSEDSGFGQLRFKQFELTYVNHIPVNQLSDAGAVFPDIAWRADATRFLTPPESLHWHASFVLPEKQGRLRTTLKPAVRRTDNHPLLVLEMTARGIGTPATEDARRNWFDLAHEWIIKGFVDLTSEHFQTEVWGRTK